MNASPLVIIRRFPREVRFEALCRLVRDGRIALSRVIEFWPDIMD